MTEREYKEGAFLGLGYNSLTDKFCNTAIKLNQENVEIVNTGTNLSLNDYGQKVSFAFEVIESQTALADSLNISGSAFLRLGNHNLSGKINFFKQQTIKKEHTYILVKYLVENEKYRLKNPELKDEAKKILELYGEKEFIKKYGDEFIIGFGTGGEYIALIEAVSLSEERRTNLVGDIQTEIDFLIKKFEAKGSYNSESTKQSSEKSLRIKSYRVGCKNAGFTVNLEQIVQEINHLALDVKNSSIKYSLIFSDYDILEMPSVYNIITQELQEQKYALAKLGYKRMEHEMRLSHIINCLESNPNDDALLEAHRKINNRIIQIEDYARECIKYPEFVEEEKFKRLFDEI